MAVIVDSSVWIDYLFGRMLPEIESATVAAGLVMTPIVVAEILSGEIGPQQRATFGELLQDYPLHQTTLGHWMAVGELRRTLARHGLNVTIPDAHIAQCALDLDAELLSRDEIFTRIAKHTSLRLAQLR